MTQNHQAQDHQAQDQQPAERLLEAITVLAPPPSFAHTDIERRYNDGVYTRRLDAELDDILRSSMPSAARDQFEEQPLSLHESNDIAALRTLTCLALVEGGQVLPLFDLSHLPEAATPLEKVRLLQSAARALLGLVEALIDEPEHFRGDDEEERGHGVSAK